MNGPELVEASVYARQVRPGDRVFSKYDAARRVVAVEHHEHTVRLNLDGFGWTEMSYRQRVSVLRAAA